ncbi:MAG: TAXI family TRAP transporter solute-binding subunit [Phormidesmis sp.]
MGPYAVMLSLLRRIRRTTLVSLAIVTVPFGLVPFSLVGCTPAPKTIRIATGSTTGYYYRLGQSIQISIEETVDLEVEVAESEGSLDNLQQLLDGETDIALVQLDVVQKSMKAGEVKAIAVLAQEHLHLISRQRATIPSGAVSGAASIPTNSQDSIQDLRGKTLAVGTPGSGIRFTADELLKVSRMDAPGVIKINESSFSEALDLLSQDKIDGAFYVGRLGANNRLREAFTADAGLTLLPLSPGLVNFLTTQYPGVYQAASIPQGVYGVYPSIPETTIASLTTPTVLVTRTDANAETVRLITWSIVATARRYAPFYPELQLEDPNLRLRQGLFYIHPEAIKVYEQGDPREAWIRYWENNSDLQAGLFLLLGTSMAGMLLQYWRKQQSRRLLARTHESVADISQLLDQDPQAALREIEELSQENRLKFIAGKVPDDVYSLVQQKTQTFRDQCRLVLDRRQKQLVLNTLLLLDDWQETLQSDPQAALGKLSEIKQQYREMLLADQVDIQAYMELVELTLISVMTLTPKHEEVRNEASGHTEIRREPQVVYAEDKPTEKGR